MVIKIKNKHFKNLRRDFNMAVITRVNRELKEEGLTLRFYYVDENTINLPDYFNDIDMREFFANSDVKDTVEVLKRATLREVITHGHIKK